MNYRSDPMTDHRNGAEVGESVTEAKRRAVPATLNS